MTWTLIGLLCLCAVVRTQVIPGKSRASDGDYNNVNTDGSFDFGYANHDRGASYHLARGTASGVVGGRFGSRDPATNTIKETVYTAGPRGFRAKGPNIHRKMDLDQRPRGPIGSKDDPYYDPSEDPSYGFKFNTRTYSKNENADSRGDVKGHYSYVDDVGERHDVSYIAGRDTGFHVQSAVPDNPSLIGAPFHRAPLVRGEAKPRGKMAVQRGLDGSYRFISAGPDQRRSESSDSHGNVRGSYTFLDDKGVQRTVNYIAGPGIGYRIVKNGKDPLIPGYFPTIPSAYDPDFVSAGSLRPALSLDDSAADDVFKRPDATAASGHVKPPPFADKDGSRPGKPTPASSENDSTESGYRYQKPFGSNSGSSESTRPTSGSKRPSFGAKGSGGSKRPGYGPSGTSGSTGPSFSSDESNYADEDVGFDGKSTKGPGKPRRPIKPTKKPYVPLKPTNNADDFEGDKDTHTPQFAIGFNINSKSDTSGGESRAKGSNKGTTTIYNPGSTIIRNIGDDYFGVPPGVSVRAHVQSIDLYPYDSKPMSPSEAIEKEKT